MCVCAQHIWHHVPYYHEILCRIARVDPTLVLTKPNIQAPVQFVFDCPVRACMTQRGGSVLAAHPADEVPDSCSRLKDRNYWDFDAIALTRGVFVAGCIVVIVEDQLKLVAGRDAVQDRKNPCLPPDRARRSVMFRAAQTSGSRTGS